MNKKKYFTYFNKKEAEEYIGKMCMFSNRPMDLETRQCESGILDSVDESNHPFVNREAICYDFCSPIEKTLRPYESFEEMVEDAVKHGSDGCNFILVGKSTKERYSASLRLKGVLVYDYNPKRFKCTSFKEMVDLYTWLDSTPCGVEEEV